VHGAQVNRSGSVIGGRFRLEALIGRGAMAEVYKAVDTKTNEAVALKILREQQVRDTASMTRFVREADAQSRVQHRNVAALLAVGLTKDELQPYLALELLAGKSLRAVLKREAVPPPRAAKLMLQALHGLAAVHDAGILHRDLKPENIMIEPAGGADERVVLIDFGFATFEGSASPTLRGTVVGSLTYIAPERLRGEVPDSRADLYSTGVILFELLTGQPPFVADDSVTLIDLHLRAPPRACATSTRRCRMRSTR
jgi:eukaryotic-like serine/threonine-protein kinase